MDAEQRRAAALAQVRTWGDPVLRERALPVVAFDAALRAEVAEMGRLLDDARGAGLAATQLGVLRRIFVYRMPDGPLEVMVNPEITWRSDEHAVFEEGCLSLPGVWFEVERPERVRIRARDAHGAGRERELEGPEADVAQHELDHLDGILVLDRIPREARREAIRQLRDAA